MNFRPITKERYFDYAYMWLRRVARISSVKASPLQQIVPFSLKRTDSAFCVLGNGPFRSGTYLIHSILAELGLWADIGVHLNPGLWHPMSKPGMRKFPAHHCATHHALGKARPGQMLAAHLPWTKELSTALANHKYKHVFIYRDPRDCFVSRFNYRKYSTGAEWDIESSKRGRAKWLAAFANDDELLADIISHRAEWDHMRYKAWLSHPNTCAVKFEDLDADLKSLKSGSVGTTLARLLEYLGVEPQSVNLDRLASKEIRVSVNSSPEVHKVGQYKRVFKDQHYAMLDNPEFRGILDTFNYEW